MPRKNSNKLQSKTIIHQKNELNDVDEWIPQQSQRRYMRLVVMFDLPVKTQAQKRAYVLFRRFLLKDGYIILQFSIYSRLLSGHDALEKHLKRLKNHLPEYGSVRCLQLTEKQFAGMEILVGGMSMQEQKVGKQICLFF